MKGYVPIRSTSIQVRCCNCRNVYMANCMRGTVLDMNLARCPKCNHRNVVPTVYNRENLVKWKEKYGEV